MGACLHLGDCLLIVTSIGKGRNYSNHIILRDLFGKGGKKKRKREDNEMI